MAHCASGLNGSPPTLRHVKSPITARYKIAARCLETSKGKPEAIKRELHLLQPLFRAKWEIPLPRFAVEKIFRFAWHLTSIAWVCLSLGALGWSPLDSLALCALLSGAIIFVMLRGHLAWPLFLVSGAAALLAADHMPQVALQAMVISAALVSLAASAVHVYWALGGRRGLQAAIPHNAQGQPVFTPGPLLTMAVASALATLGLLQLSPLLGLDMGWLRWPMLAAIALLGLRTVGDGKSVGLSKSDHTTTFARMDDALYTPLVVLLAFGTTAAYLLS